MAGVSVLDVLLEGFDAGKHPRDWRGRWKVGDHVTLQHGMFGKVPARVTRVTASRVHVSSSDPRVSDTSMTHNQAAVKLARGVSPAVADIQRAQALRGGAKHVPGDKVHVVTPQGHVLNGTVHRGPQTYDVITSRGAERSTTIEVHWADGDVTHERPQDVEPGHKGAPAPATRAITQQMEAGRRAAATRAEILAKSPGAQRELAQHRAIAQGARSAPPLKPFSKEVRAGLPQGDNPPTAAAQRQLGRVLADIQQNTRDYTTAQGLVRWHLARANVRSVPKLSGRELSLLIKELEGLAKHGPSALEAVAPAPEVLGALLSERFVSQAARAKAASKGHALHVDGRDIFPIESAKDAQNALTLWRSGHHKTAAARAHILRNARRVGATSVVNELSGGS